jgi:hypothetical protein
VIGSTQIKAPGASPSPKPVAKPQPVTGGYSGQSSIQQPRYISDATTESAAGNTMAQGYANADQRYQTKQLARNGVSAGAGQQFVAAQSGVQEMGKAAQQAADIRSQDQLANDKMRSDYEQMREKEALNLSKVQHQLSQADWAKQFAEQSAAAQLQMAYYQSRLQLMLAMLR